MHGDSRSVTEQPATLSTCAAAGSPMAATTLERRGLEQADGVTTSYLGIKLLPMKAAAGTSDGNVRLIGGPSRE